MARFTIDKKLVVQIRYYEHMYVIYDDRGERVYTGSDEKQAQTILRLLNGYYHGSPRRKPLAKGKKVRVKGKR